jgi:hypothetical protein
MFCAWILQLTLSEVLSAEGTTTKSVSGFCRLSHTVNTNAASVLYKIILFFAALPPTFAERGQPDALVRKRQLLKGSPVAGGG